MYRDEKIAHMAAYLIRKLGGKVSRLRLMKLLYLADRKSLEKYGYSISGDKFVSMDLGPVLSSAYSFMSGKHKDQSVWDELIDNIDGKTPCHALRDKSLYLGALSENDEEIMDEIAASYGKMSSSQLVNYVHNNCIEWEDPKGTSKPIALRKILSNLGYTREDAELYESHATSLDAVESGKFII